MLLLLLHVCKSLLNSFRAILFSLPFFKFSLKILTHITYLFRLLWYLCLYVGGDEAHNLWMMMIDGESRVHARRGGLACSSRKPVGQLRIGTTQARKVLMVSMIKESL